MATNFCKHDAPAKPPKFFKIITDPNDHRLKIPPEFLRRNGHNLPDIIFLKVPTGSSWKVELKRTGNKIWLEKGWQEFKKQYLIEIGYFLVFEYQGNAEFNVVICDITASEIEYPLVKVVEIGSESDDSDVILKDIFTRKRERNMPKAANNEKGCKSSVTGSSIQVPEAVDRKALPAYQRAKSFKSKNPFHISVIQPSCVSGIFSVTIPLSLANEILPAKRNNLELRVRDAKTWTVSCNISTCNAKINSAGWKRFVEENKLKVGDVCVFEMVKTEELVWNVTIFRS